MNVECLVLNPSTQAERLRTFGLIGHILASASVRREMPYMVHRNGSLWVVAMDEIGETIGIGSVDLTPRFAWLRNVYVLSSKRKQGVFVKIHERQMEVARRSGASRVRTMVLASAMESMEKRGFTKVGGRGKFVTMECVL